MENYNRVTNTGNSYAERAIYDEIIANLDSFVLSACETQENEKKIKVEKLDTWGDPEDSRLCSIMNDHNYILRSRSPQISYCMRENLIDFVKKHSSTSLSSSEDTIEKMIDSVMRLLRNATDYDVVIEKLEYACDPNPKETPKIELAEDQVVSESKNQTEEECVQRKNEQSSIKVEINLSPVKEQESSLSIKDEIVCDSKPPLLLISESAVAPNIPPAVESYQEQANENLIEKSPANLEECTDNKNKTQSGDSPHHIENSQTSQPDSSAKEGPPVSTDENNVTENTQEKPSVITELLKFAEKLQEDCTAITSKVEFDLSSFLATNFKEYKNIMNSANKHQFTDSSVQTVKVISKKKLRKINAKDKRLLLQSSNDSDSSDSSYIEKNLSGIDTAFNSKKPLDLDKKLDAKKDALDRNKSPKFFADSDSEQECMKSDSSDTDESDTSSSKSSDDSNDSDSSSSNEKERDKSKCSTSNSKDDHDKEKDPEKGTNESDKENRSLFESPETSVVEKSKEDSKVDEDNQDKQIERLLNLKGLTEPQKNTSLPNNSKPTKLANKSKTDRLFAVMQEADKNSSSEDSGHEEGEPVLTEKQFLFKCNENLKQQLLNSASSESENFNSDEDADIINKINDLSDDEDEKHLSNVDKFLETLVDTEENSPAANDLPKPASPTKSLDTSTDKNSSVIELDDTDPTESTKTDQDQDTLGFKKKEVPQKSFENLLSNEKRQKPKPPEELIDLSGESSNSDVEEFSVEPKEKSQRIKPMLRQDQLESETIYSQKKEAERLRKLEKKNTYLTKMLKYSKDSISESDLVLDYATSNKKFIKVHPDIVKHLKPHQRDGVKFMYDSCYGCVDNLKENSGSGCILAHCMGLGKTLQIIALLHTVTTHKELKTSKVLVLCPKSTIMNWADEIQRWLGPLDKKTIQIFNFSDTADVFEKINVLRQWSSSIGKAGCMIMGYEAFRSLVFYNSNKNRMKSAKKIEDIRASINKYLLKPGADLVVCDEGHIIKNRKSGISLAAAKIVTPKRIVLTGTPIQNNLKEYYSMVNFIKPLILGTEKEFANLYANPIKNGQHKDSSKRDIKVMKQRSFVLHKKLSKFVQRKEAELLQSFLPQKFEYVLFIPMTDVQNNLYEYVLDAISKREDSRGRSLITDYTCLRKIWTHPKVLEDAWKNAITAKNKKEPRKATALGHSDDDQPDDIYDSQTGVISVQRDWWRSMLTETDLESIIPSNKLKTMFEIIRMSEENGEKCLIFSAFVAVLNVVEFFLNKINDKKRNFYMFDGQSDKSSAGHWVNGQDYYRLDGKTNKTLRHEMIKRFNDPKNKRARLFLISARAGGQGINLIGANRVIILDTSWNPANDQQNIFRIFRLGQKKNCYVYRLIAMGTMEEKVYSRSVTKQAMSFRVVDEQQIDRHYSMAELAELYTLTKPDYSERPVPVFPQDQILANLLLNFPELVYKYHEHDSLLENKVEQELSEQEKADAWVAYERDLQMNSESREVTDGYHGHTLFGQGNYMYPMGDFDPNSLLPSFDPTQMDMAARNPLGAFPNYLVNRTSYLDIINMYKKFSTTLMNDKNNRNARYNPNYAMSLASGMMNSAMCNVMPPTDTHLSALANPLNPYYPLHSLANPKNPFGNPLNANAMMANPNLAALSQVSTERYERNKNIISVDDPIPPSLCNYNLPLPPYPKDLTDRSLQAKNLIQNTSPALSVSPTRQQSQNVFNPNLNKEIPGIPRNIIQKKRGKPPGTSSPLRHSNSPLDSVSKSKASDSLLRTPSPAQSLALTDPVSKMFDPSAVPGAVNMGIVYPKPVTISPPSGSENSEGGCLMNSGSSMQIIPTHTQLAESVRKKFDNISPNISLTAVRTLPKSLQSEQVQPTLNSSHMEVIPSNTRKRRNSLSSTLIPDSDRDKIFNAKASPLSSIDQPSYPPKVTKF